MPELCAQGKADSACAAVPLRRSRHAWSVVFGPAQPSRGLGTKTPHAKAPSAAMAKAGRPMSTLWVGRGWGKNSLKMPSTKLHFFSGDPQCRMSELTAPLSRGGLAAVRTLQAAAVSAEGEGSDSEAGSDDDFEYESSGGGSLPDDSGGECSSRSESGDEAHGSTTGAAPADDDESDASSVASEVAACRCVRCDYAIDPDPHLMVTADEPLTCNGCGRTLPPTELRFNCQRSTAEDENDFDVCAACAGMTRSRQRPPSPSAPPPLAQSCVVRLPTAADAAAARATRGGG